MTELRGSLGLCNFFSEYVEHYAEAASPLMGMLEFSRADGKKGSKKKLEWTGEAEMAFELLKQKLTKQLELYQVDPERPSVLRTDATDYAIGAVLEQQHPDDKRADLIELNKTRLVPVSFYSRKLAESQLNWTPREKETYAIVASLRK